MQSTTFTFKSHAGDDADIFTFKWLPDAGTAVRGVVQIVHGMAEHAARYAPVAEALTRAGFAVYANDHRGHGKTPKREDDVGHFADTDGWNKAIADLHQLNQLARTEQPGVPVVMLGHSLGSFLTQHMMFSHAGDVDAAVLSGSNGKVGAIAIAGKIAIAIEKLRSGARGKSKLLDTMSFGAFNNAFKPARTKFDWLSRVPAEVDAYVADARCGFLCTNQFWQDMMGGLDTIADPTNQARVRKDLPVYVFSGALDPVSNATKNLQQLLSAYRVAGLTRVETKIYPDGRHEMFNEVNRDEVLRDLVAWLERAVPAKSAAAAA